MAFNSDSVVKAVNLLNIPVHTALREAVIQLSVQWEKGPTNGELYDLLNKVNTSVGGVMVPGKAMALYITEVCGLDSYVAMPFLAEVGRFLAFQEKIATK